MLAQPRKDAPYRDASAPASEYDRAWDRIETAYSLRPGTALWWEEGYAEVAKHRAAQAERARQEASLRDLRARLARERSGASPEARARAWLSFRRTDSSDAAFRACVGLVRGFALSERTALTLMEADYVPRFHRALPKGELLGMVRRAAKASKPMGYLLEEERGR